MVQSGQSKVRTHMTIQLDIFVGGSTSESVFQRQNGLMVSIFHAKGKSQYEKTAE